MELSTGKITLPIKFDNGDVEYIAINPHSKGLQDRIKSFENSIHKRLETIKMEKYKEVFSGDIDISKLNVAQIMDLDEENLAQITKQADALTEIDKELQKIVCDEIDNVFESSVSEKAFKYVPPLAIVPLDNDGKDFDFYVLLFLKALSVELQKYNDKMNKATEKHIGKYRK
jgi:hypothetical protein